MVFSVLRRKVFTLPVLGVVVFVAAFYTCGLLMRPGIDSGYGEEEVRNRGRTEDLRVVNRIPQWSSDGQVIVVNIGLGIMGVSVDGDELWEITKGESEKVEQSDEPVQYGPPPRSPAQFSPVVSPSGQVAYQHSVYDDGWFGSGEYERSIRIVYLDGTNVKKLGGFSSTRLINPAWSPDGSRIAFITRSLVDDGGVQREMVVMERDGASVRRFPLSGSTGLEITTRWSGRMTASTSRLQGVHASSATLRPSLQRSGRMGLRSESSEKRTGEIRRWHGRRQTTPYTS